VTGIWPNWEGSSEAEVAQMLDLSQGTVKSQASWGLARLREPAWFAVGAGTAYGGPIVSIDRVVIDVGSAAGGNAGHVNVTLGMGANGPKGKAIPITVTAFASGIPPKP
jgi:hypothetical protein